MEVSISSWRRWSTLAPATCWSSTTAVVRTKRASETSSRWRRRRPASPESSSGLHRDTPELLEIDLPLFSLGAVPTGPLRLDRRDADALRSARVGPWIVGPDDVALADENGVLFVPMTRAKDVATAARSIRDTEHAQAATMRRGTSLRTQLQFTQFVARRAANPAFTFREHLRGIGGPVEE
jgi:4-hydroxy-4-methyl-2-oxoglutarate aldolase